MFNDFKNLGGATDLKIIIIKKYEYGLFTDYLLFKPAMDHPSVKWFVHMLKSSDEISLSKNILVNLIILN